MFLNYLDKDGLLEANLTLHPRPTDLAAIHVGQTTALAQRLGLHHQRFNSNVLTYQPIFDAGYDGNAIQPLLAVHNIILTPLLHLICEV